MSAGGPMVGEPDACSGAIYSGVPTIEPWMVWPAGPLSCLASPKSLILGRPR